jgi:MFS family permease
MTSTPILILGWVAMGITVSLFAMILPFRRGTLGVAINILVSIGAAILGGYAGRMIDAFESPNLSFALAAISAAVVNVLMHVAVLRRPRTNH